MKFFYKRRREQGFLYVLPVLVIVFFILVFPLIYNVYLSFHQSDLYSIDLSFVGLRNYYDLVRDSGFLNAFQNTLIWTFWSVFFQVLLGLVAAILLQRISYGKRIFQILIMLPWIVPGIAAAASWRWLYHPDFGIINYLMSLLGYDPVIWLGDPNLALPAVIVVNIWKMYPFAMLIVLARLQAIPSSIYEAAEIDGGNSLQIFLRITLPMIRGVLSILTLLLTIWSFNAFTFIYAMTGGGPARSSEILGLRIYRDALENMLFGKAAAEAIFLFIIILAFSVVYLHYTYDWEEGV
ncbi:MAG: arabinogalactan oligomer / maltooligosaccharide transport system permease protein [Candidatus Atribacteria bacterium]|nr:arabinogalactan oligomer / maltooligosaccharide transport system permease protein [Candidatus Atribacteria bacterium]